MRIKVDAKKIMTLMFVLYFTTDLIFAYTALSRIMLFLFCGMSLLFIRKIYKNPFLVSYILWGCWSFLNIYLGYALDKDVAMEMTMTLVLNSIFLFAFTQYCGLMKTPIQVLKTYKNICIFASCFFCVLGFPSIIAGERLNVLGINANAIGTFAAYSLVILIYESYESRRIDINNLLVFILFVFVVLLSGSRKAFIIPVLGWYIMLCFRKPKQFLKYSALVIIGIVFLVFISLEIDVLYNVIGYRIQPVLLFFKGESIEEASLLTRTHFIEYAWKSSQDNLFFGQGLDCFRILPKAYDTYSHCNYLEILFSTGIMGVLIYYGMIGSALLGIKKILKYNKNGDIELLMALIIPFLICDFFNVTYFTRRMIMIPSLVVMFLRRYKNGNY